MANKIPKWYKSGYEKERYIDKDQEADSKSRGFVEAPADLQNSSNTFVFVFFILIIIGFLVFAIGWNTKQQYDMSVAAGVIMLAAVFQLLFNLGRVAKAVKKLEEQQKEASKDFQIDVHYDQENVYLNVEDTHSKNNIDNNESDKIYETDIVKPDNNETFDPQFDLEIVEEYIEEANEEMKEFEETLDRNEDENLNDISDK